jgi:hypothetical protein
VTGRRLGVRETERGSFAMSSLSAPKRMPRSLGPYVAAGLAGVLVGIWVLLKYIGHGL